MAQVMGTCWKSQNWNDKNWEREELYLSTPSPTRKPIISEGGGSQEPLIPVGNLPEDVYMEKKQKSARSGTEEEVCIWPLNY